MPRNLNKTVCLWVWLTEYIFYCKRAILFSLVFQNIGPPSPSLPGECVPPAFVAGGGQTRRVERGMGGLRMRSSLPRMRSSLVVRASDCQCTSCNGPGFDPIIRRHSGIWGAADEAVLNIVRTKRIFWKTREIGLPSYSKICPLWFGF
jgi:hypothetical protein